MNEWYIKRIITACWMNTNDRNMNILDDVKLCSKSFRLKRKKKGKYILDYIIMMMFRKMCVMQSWPTYIYRHLRYVQKYLKNWIRWIMKIDMCIINISIKKASLLLGITWYALYNRYINNIYSFCFLHTPS